MFRTRMPEILMVFLIVCVPSWTGFVDFQSARLLPLRIETDKGSPAYAALEDARELPNLLIPHVDNTPVSQVEHLVAGEKTFTLPEPERLGGLVVRQEPAVLEPKGLITVREPNDMPLVARQQIVLNEADPDDWKLPSLRDTAKPLIEQALKERIAWENRSEQNGVYLASPLRKPSAALPQTFEEVAHTNINNDNFEPLQPVTVTHNNKRPLLLAGQIEMSGGLAYTGNDAELKVFRMNRNRIVETEPGKVWVNEGRFEIHVREAVGQLVAELRNREGELQGLGEINLSALEIPTNGGKVSNIHVKLRPASSGVRTTVVSAYSFGSHRMPMADAKVFVKGIERELRSNEDGEFLEPDVDRKSIFVVRAEANKNWDTLMMSTADLPSEMPVFPNAMIKALMQLTMGAGYELAMSKSVVWGRVVDERGQPIRGAKVEIADQEKDRAIYFDNMYLPNRHFTGTTENGYFAFIDINPGVQTLRTFVRGQMIPAQVFPTEPGKVTYVELQKGSTRFATVHAYEAFGSQRPSTVVLNVVGSEKDIELTGEGLVRFTGGTGTLTIEAQGESADFEFMRVQVPRSVQNINFPLVRRQWTQTMAAQNQVTLEPDRGVIIGFFEDDDFEVFLDEGLNFPAQNIVYFNAEGRSLRLKEGARGGGFIMYNVPLGLRTVTVIPKHGKEYLVRTLVAEPGVLNLLK